MIRMSNILQGLTFGSSAKIYLSFDAPWWSENPGNFALMWNDDDRQEYENDVGQDDNNHQSYIP